MGPGRPVRVDVARPDRRKFGRKRRTCQLEGDELGGHGRSDVGAEDHAHRLLQGDQAGADKSDQHDRGRRGRLDHGGHQGSREAADDPVGRDGAEDALYLRPGTHLQTVGHHVHAEDENPQPADRLNQYVQKVQVHGSVRWKLQGGDPMQII